MSKSREVLTTGQIAVICRVAPRTVSKWFDTGQLKGYRVPGSKDRRVPVGELLRFMRANGMPCHDIDAGATRVLIVLTDVHFGDSLKTMLDREKWIECAACDSMLAAGIMTSRLNPHVILVDADASELEPVTLPTGLRRNDRHQGIRLVAITRRAESVAGLTKAGYDACVIAPFEAKELLQVISRLAESDSARV